MKKPSLLTGIKIMVVCGIIAHCFAGCVAHAQTNAAPAMPAFTSDPTPNGAINQFVDAAINSTNFALVTAVGMKIGDSKIKIAAVDYIYNVSGNVGLILGYDYLWGSEVQGNSANVVKGGLQLRTELSPFKGAFKVTPFVAELVASPVSGTQNSGGAGIISVVGFDVKLWQFKSIVLHGGYLYENRTAQGDFTGNYQLIHAGISLNF